MNNRVPPTISYKYTKTIAGRIFNQKKVVEELEVDSGTKDMTVVKVNTAMSLQDM